MARLSGTGKTAIANLALPAKGNQILYADQEQRGLAVRVTRGGSRSWVVDKNTTRGRIRITLGPAGTDSLTPVQARGQTRIALGLIAEGYTAEQVKARIDRVEDRIPDGAITLQQALDQYLAERAHKLAQRTKDDYQGLVDTYLADWQHRPLEVIDEAAVVVKFTSITSAARANYSFRLVRALFNYAASIRDHEGKPVVAGNPVDVLSQRRIWHTDKDRRDDVIAQVNIKPWWRAVKALETDATRDNSDTVRDFLRFLVLTGLRRNEAATLRWETVDLAAKTFTVPLTKNKTAHTLPLPKYLLDLLKRRHAAMLKLEADDPRRAWVFPGEVGALAEPKKLIAKVVQSSGVKFSSHTLRRTFASIAARHVPYLVLQRMLNHKPQGVTSRHYTTIDVEQLRAPMRQVNDLILRAAGERRGAAVVKIDQRRAA